MSMEVKHISVCVCTFKRPDLLRRLLNKLDEQQTKGLFSYSVVVADNDALQSARQVVRDFSAVSSIQTIYCVEPEQNIALARNKALENATGDFIAYIDDDEVPENDWLYNLFKTCNAYGVDGVLGPVKPSFECVPPPWVIKGRFFERPAYDTGYKLACSETRTGNVLLKRSILNENKNWFRAKFGTGSEDVDFFRRMMETGKVFVWCNDAAVYESIPLQRCKRSYLLKMALLRGGNSLKHQGGRFRSIIKSFIAVPVYGCALPFLFIAGDHHFMKYLIKFCDHAGKLLSLIGINPVETRNF